MVEMEDGKFYEDHDGRLWGPAALKNPDDELCFATPVVGSDPLVVERRNRAGKALPGYVRDSDLVREVSGEELRHWLKAIDYGVRNFTQWLELAAEAGFKPATLPSAADKVTWVKVDLDEDELRQTIQKGTDLWAGQVGGNHYTKHRIQPLEFMMANRLDGTESLVLKYICRWRDKGGIEDLHKARDVLAKMIDFAERNPEYVKP